MAFLRFMGANCLAKLNFPKEKQRYLPYDSDSEPNTVTSFSIIFIRDRNRIPLY